MFPTIGTRFTNADAVLLRSHACCTGNANEGLRCCVGFACWHSITLKTSSTHIRWVSARTATFLISERVEARPVWGHFDLPGESERHNLDRHLKVWMGWVFPVQIKSESSVVRFFKRISVGKTPQYDKVNGLRFGVFRKIFPPNGASPDSNIFLTRENRRISKSSLFNLIAESP